MELFCHTQEFADRQLVGVVKTSDIEVWSVMRLIPFYLSFHLLLHTLSILSHQRRSMRSDSGSAGVELMTQSVHHIGTIKLLVSLVKS